ncbi:hypothetical protein [Ectothiorhodospira lacustris]|uniref:hypothetical protein n=1 Tax=Ectothiorhodospira lacustris TaxID=2899127 RepID=UPI001EE8845F|nr:hypothetical protein [Ectothiorhodospira lacustris]MCG5510185.1 hypothetical protein [Ectothiorhodospira lacustris]MCG5522028.1 hypothetical protein [Ectothiorhodospira lacustris]
MDGKINIPADRATPGAVLAEDVRDRSGRLLLSAGLPLRDKHIRVLKTWGVNEVAIWTDREVPLMHTESSATVPSLRDSSDISETSWTQAKSIMSTAFMHADLASPVMDTLFKVSTARLARKLDAKAGP